MKTHPSQSFALALCVAACLLPSCATHPAPSANASPDALNPAQFIPASDPRFRFEGRLDFTHSNAPVAVWQASRIRLDFTGDALGLVFDKADGQNFFNVQIDASTSAIGIPRTPGPHTTIFRNLGPGRHSLMLFKRSEANAGTVAFRGVDLLAGAQAWAAAQDSNQIRMEFIGDSITVGACNEDGAADQWENRATHNSALSWAALTAAAFNADHRNTAVSGMGVSAGYVNVKAGEVWDRVRPTRSAPRADLSAWQPQVVLIHLGENDDSFTRGHHQPFPAGFTDGYVALVHAVRAAYPAAHIVLLRGGMFGGAQSAPLRAAWESAVARLEAADPDIRHFVFTHWSRLHPRVADDQAMAQELVAWLQTQPFMKQGTQH
jgi:lysophospholipase L1-like esterase